MPRHSRLDDQLAALSALREDPRGPAADALLRRSLEDRHGMVVAGAASIIGDAGLQHLYDLLPPAFERLVEGGVEHDRGCRGKLAIAAALLQNEVEAAQVFLTGIRLVQREPVWGGSVDTAAGLRGTCGMGLAMLDHPDALDALATLLADPEAQARAAAACALGNTGRGEAIPLLRYKCLVGDEAPDVLTEAYTSLLAIRWAASLPFVAGFLRSEHDSTAECAALALGQSRRDEAFPFLRDYAAQARPSLIRGALLALGLLRTPEATEVLVAVVAEGSVPRASHALSALAIQRFDETLSKRVRAVVKGRKLRALDQALAAAWAD